MDEGQIAEFEKFYDGWFAKVYNYARHRTGSAAAADEIVSDVFTRVLEGWNRFDPAAGERGAWAFGIARNVVADRYRSWRRRAWEGLRALFDKPEPGPGPEEAAVRAEESRRLLRALSGLDDRARDIVCLRHHADMSNGAIAALLGITEGNVAVILFRSIRRLQVLLREGSCSHGR